MLSVPPIYVKVSPCTPNRCRIPGIERGEHGGGGRCDAREAPFQRDPPIFRPTGHRPTDRPTDLPSSISSSVQSSSSHHAQLNINNANGWPLDGRDLRELSVAPAKFLSK